MPDFIRNLAAFVTVLCDAVLVALCPCSHEDDH